VSRSLAVGLALVGALAAQAATQAAAPHAAASQQPAAPAVAASATARPAAAPRATVDMLQWLAGHWRSAQSEEVWLAPRDGLMLAVTRELLATAAGAAAPRVGFEYLRIEQHDGTLVLQASPGGKPPTAFGLTGIGPQRVRFSSLSNDFPQHILYWREGAALRARIEGEVAGRTQAIDFSWTLDTAPAPAASAPAVP
jgi:hypothetical protein